ncbi:MAG: electron transfer flavoprotein subunit alpha/FixB family protein [Clostridia bacterium]|nr:electron transfer flavoprotein subunit alpha/FixB family protein [Clostridia bacterium]
MRLCVLCPYGLDEGLLSKAVALCPTEPVRVLVPEKDALAAARYGAALIHILPSADSDEMQLALWLKGKIEEWESNAVLAPASIAMRNLMPYLAFLASAGLTADCTALTREGETLLQTRPAFGNSLMATIKSLSPVQMATVRPGTFRAVVRPAECPRVTVEAPVFTESTVTVREERLYADAVPLSQAQIIVAGGAGIGSAAGFQKLERLAARLGGSVAASRNAVDAGFAPFRCQVGMTGVTVCPKIYLAVGISGAVQHLAGMNGAETVIAINSDPKAPIFDYADYGIVGDWEAVIDALLEEEQ